MLFGKQAFPFPISGEVYKVSYEKLLAKNLDTTQARDLTHVVDTTSYYQAQTQDGTTTGDPHRACYTKRYLLSHHACQYPSLERPTEGCVWLIMLQGHRRFLAHTLRWATSRCLPA